MKAWMCRGAKSGCASASCCRRRWVAVRFRCVARQLGRLRRAVTKRASVLCRLYAAAWHESTPPGRIYDRLPSAFPSRRGRRL
eukprot:365369-Chlamydomonas_euryale.AAC.10